MPAPVITLRSVKGTNLTPQEVDDNFTAHQAAIVDLQDNPPTPNEISNITTGDGGTTFTIHLGDGSTFGPFQLPIALFQPRGQWANDTTYSPLDIIGVPLFGVFMVLKGHTTDSFESFDPARQEDGDDCYFLIVPIGGARALKTISDPDYTLEQYDDLYYLRFDNAAGCDVTLTDDVFSEGALFKMVATQGPLTLIEGSAVTINTPPDRDPVSRAAFSKIELYLVSNSEGDLSGDLQETSV
jgi:hypothetical protein